MLHGDHKALAIRPEEGPNPTGLLDAQHPAHMSDGGEQMNENKGTARFVVFCISADISENISVGPMVEKNPPTARTGLRRDRAVDVKCGFKTETNRKDKRMAWW